MSALGMVWAMLGPRAMIAIAVAALVLYGRSGVLRSRQAQTLWSWMSPARRVPGSATGKAPASPAAGGMTSGDRTFWFLTILAATALAAWIVTRTIIVTPTVSH